MKRTVKYYQILLPAVLIFVLLLSTSVFSQDKKDNKDIDKIYKEIAGDYKYEIGKLKSTVSMYVKDKTLYAKDKMMPDVESKIVPEDINNLKFKMISNRNGKIKIIKVVFFRDKKEKISKCVVSDKTDKLECFRIEVKK